MLCFYLKLLLGIKLICETIVTNISLFSFSTVFSFSTEVKVLIFPSSYTVGLLCYRPVTCAFLNVNFLTEDIPGELFF